MRRRDHAPAALCEPAHHTDAPTSNYFQTTLAPLLAHPRPHSPRRHPGPMGPARSSTPHASIALLALAATTRSGITARHNWPTLPVLVAQLMQVQALFEAFEEQLDVPSRSIQCHQVFPTPLRSLGGRASQYEVGPPHQLVVVIAPVLLAQCGLLAAQAFLACSVGKR